MLGLLLVMGFLGCQKEVASVREVKVDAILPLSGILSPAGKAFAKGLGELGNAPSDSVMITLKLLDNASQSDSTRALLAMPRNSFVVAGIGYATIELAPRKEGFSLWVGQDPEAPQGWTPLSASSQSQSRLLLAWCKAAPRPLAIVFAATAQWAPLVQEQLAPGLDSVTLIPHDGGETQWNREATRLIVVKPASILLWHGLDQARSLLARPDMDSLRLQARMLGPNGSGTKESWGPVWEPSSQPDAAELAFWQEMGRQAAQRLRKAILNPVPPLDPVPHWIREGTETKTLGKL